MGLNTSGFVEISYRDRRWNKYIGFVHPMPVTTCEARAAHHQIDEKVGIAISVLKQNRVPNKSQPTFLFLYCYNGLEVSVARPLSEGSPRLRCGSD